MQKRPDLIVSVESRKGGVGKTTAALCLARLLQKRGYAALVLDLDVTGTNAADIATSPFWNNYLNVVNDEKKQPVNILKLLEQNFMLNKDIPDFSINTSDSMNINLEKVNVLGSQIYKTVQDDSICITCLESPGILFDDLYTFWLLELVQRIIDNFIRIAHDNKSVKTAIIIDNSPGYVGIAPAVHEWLTNCGPDHNKFLIVTSLDVQDMLACERAILTLHGLYCGKWNTSRIFTAMEHGKETSKSIDKNCEAFFMQLAAPDSETEDQLVFYRDDQGREFVNDLSKYISIIINRVPRAVKNGDIDYQIKPFHIIDESINIFNGDLRKIMISYDEYIENQFLVTLLRPKRTTQSDRRIKRLQQILESAERELRMLINSGEHGVMPSLEQERVNYSKLRTQLIKANDVVIRARSAIGDAGLGYLARLIHDEWLPGNISIEFRSALSKILRENDLLHFEMPDDIASGPENPDACEIINDFKHHLLIKLQSLQIPQIKESENSTINVLASVLSTSVGLSLTFPLWHSPYQEEITELFVAVLAIEYIRWKSREKEYYNKFSIQKFLAQESINHVDVKGIFLQFMPFMRLRLFRNEEYVNFVDFYKKCTSVQARLIDFIPDSRFLIKLFQFIISNEAKDSLLFPFVRDLAESVIIRKSESYESGLHKMSKVLQNVEYFREFNEVLEKVLLDWGCEK